MNRHIAMVVTRLSLTFGSVVLAFAVLLDPWRNAEAQLVGSTFAALGLPGASHVYGSQILVLPSDAAPFMASISPSCSALAGILAFAAISLFLVTGQPGRRLVAFLAASGVVLACNFLRIGLSVLVGLNSGADGMVIFHDWIGTAFGILYVLAGFTIYLMMLLPSNRQLLKEYRRER